MISGTVVEHWSRTQAAHVLSTADAEQCAVIKGAAEALGTQSKTTDLGLCAHFRVRTDSNAAKAVASRRGLGKTRQVGLRLL